MADSICSEPFYVEIPAMTVAKDRVISTSPEEEVIARLRNWAKDQGVDIAKSRAFGFDVPVSPEEKAKGIRGYEYWLQLPGSFVIPAEAGIQTSAVEQSETLINDSLRSSAKEWMPDQVGHDDRKERTGIHTVKIEPFAGGKYIALRITEPFADPYCSTPKGWMKLVQYTGVNEINLVL
jgi:hypothetical protein